MHCGCLSYKATECCELYKLPIMTWDILSIIEFVEQQVAKFDEANNEMGTIASTTQVFLARHGLNN